MQMQRKIERQIRQDKRDIAGLQGILRSNTDDDMLIKNVKQSLTNIQIKTKQHNAKLNEFLRQTGHPVMITVYALKSCYFSISYV